MFFFISPRHLRDPSADRRETLPRDRKLAEIYTASPKIRGLSSKMGPKTFKILVNLISDFDREYLRPEIGYSPRTPTPRPLIESDSSRVQPKIPVKFGNLLFWITRYTS